MKAWHKILVIFVMTLVTAALLVTTATAAPLTQDPRPPGDSGGGDGGGDGGGTENGGNGGSNGAPSNLTCAGLTGQVLNWGVGGTGGVGVTLRTGSWQVFDTSASNGSYSFGGLGVGVATLHVDVPPGQDSKSLIQDAGIYLNCEHPLVANVALYSGDTINPDPPVSLEMSSSPQVTPGETIVIQLRVKNALPTAISHVTVTSLLPPELSPVQIAAESETAATQFVGGDVDGVLASAHLDNIPAGAEEDIFITATVSENALFGSQIQNTATLFYQESAAVQNGITFDVGNGDLSAAAPPEPAVQIAEEVTTEVATMPTAASEATSETIVSSTPIEEADAGEEFVPPGGLPTTGDSFFPPPDLLPETGQNLAVPDVLPATGLGFLIPFGGLGLGALAFALHRLRKTRNDWE